MPGTTAPAAATAPNPSHPRAPSRSSPPPANNPAWHFDMEYEAKPERNKHNVLCLEVADMIISLSLVPVFGGPATRVS